MTKNALLALASTLVCLAAVEAAVRTLRLDRVPLAEMANRSGDGPHGNRVRVDDPEIGWFLKGYRLDGGGVAIDFKPPRVFPRRKAPGTYRILVLGDSIGEVWVASEPRDKFPRMLEEALNRSTRGRTYEVVNISVGAYNTSQRAAVLRKWLPDFEFDLLVVQHCFNDIVDGYVYRRSEGGRDVYVNYSMGIPGLKVLAGSLLLRSALVRFLNLHAYRLWGGCRPSAFGLIGEFPNRQEEDYRWFKAHCSKRGAGLFVLMFPHLSDRSEPSFRQFHESDDRTGLLLDRLGIPHHCMYDDYRNAGFAAIQADPADFVHPNAAGHRMAAMRLLAHLLATP